MTLAKGDTGARGKADKAAKQNQPQDVDGWPRNEVGRPMVKIQMQAAELIPTGQYANVSIGPASVTAFVDPDQLVDAEGIFTPDEKQTIAVAINELAEIVESDVIAVQRNMVLEKLQEQV